MLTRKVCEFYGGEGIVRYVPVQGHFAPGKEVRVLTQLELDVMLQDAADPSARVAELAAAAAPSPGIAEVANVYGAGDPPQVTNATDTTPAASDAERVADAQVWPRKLSPEEVAAFCADPVAFAAEMRRGLVGFWVAPDAASDAERVAAAREALGKKFRSIAHRPSTLQLDRLWVCVFKMDGETHTVYGATEAAALEAAAAALEADGDE